MSDDDLTRVNLNKTKAGEPSPKWLTAVRSQVESLKFGTVQITVHDSEVVQIERVERTRLDRPR
jgi:hypothetical protein